MRLIAKVISPFSRWMPWLLLWLAYGRRWW